MTTADGFVLLPVSRCGNCGGDRPHHMPDSGVSVCAACGYVRDETEVRDPS